MRIVVDARVGVRYADLPEQVDRAASGLPLLGALVDLDRLDDLCSNRVDGVQGRHRILEDHRHLVAADVLQLVLVHLQHVPALVEDLALEAGVLVLGQAEQRHRRDALAGARLADDAEHLAARELEVDAVDTLHDPVFRRELDLEALDLDQALGHYVGLMRGSR